MSTAAPVGEKIETRKWVVEDLICGLESLLSRDEEAVLSGGGVMTEDVCTNQNDVREDV